MHLLWEDLRAAVPLIWSNNHYVLNVTWFTLQVAFVAVSIAAVIGLPLAVIIGLGRFRGVRVLKIIVNAGLALPPVVVGFILFLVLVGQGPLGALGLNDTRRAVFIAQTILALPYVIALGSAAVQSVPSGLLDQARLLGASRTKVGILALREARVQVIAALLAALGTALAEVGAIVVVGGNVYGYDQTLASATLFEANAGMYEYAIAIAIVLMILIVIVMGGASLLQHRRTPRVRVEGVTA
jgi:tungstate transport system permease protein